MKFKCNRDDFMSAISIAQRAVSTRTTLPILSGILISALDGMVCMTATDLEMGIECRFTCDVEDPGNTVVSARLLGEIIRKLPERDVEFYVGETNKITVKSGKSVFNLLGMDPHDFPPFPEVREHDIAVLPADLLKNMIRKTGYAVSLDQIKRVLTGEYLKIKPDELEMVALDGYRIAMCRARTHGSEEEREFIIPGRTMNELAKMIGGPEETINISTCENEIMFEFGSVRVVSRLIAGSYINYMNFIPNKFQLEVDIDALAFRDALERAFLMAKEGNNLIKITVTDKIIITSNSDIGDVYEELPVLECRGSDLEIAFNCTYLMDAVKSIDSETITLKFVESAGPCLVLPAGDEDQLNLVLPVRLRS